MAKCKFLSADPDVIISNANHIRRSAFNSYLSGNISEGEYNQERERSKAFIDYAYIQN